MNNLTNPFAWLYLMVIAMQGLISAWAFISCFKCKVKPVYAVLFETATSVLGVVPQVLFCYVSPLQPFVAIGFDVLTGLLFAEKSYPRWKVVTFWMVRLLIDGLANVGIMLPLTLMGMLDVEAGVTWFDHSRLIGTILFTVLIVPMHYIFVMLWNKAANKMDITIKKTRIMFIVFPLGQLCTLFLLIMEHAFIEISFFNELVMTMVSFLLMTMSTVFFLYFVADIETKYRLEYEIKALEHAYKSDAAYYNELEKRNYEVAKIRHDMKNHLISLRKITGTNVNDEFNQMMTELENEIASTEVVEYCSVPMINAIISEKQKICMDNYINTNYDISISDMGSVSKIHLSSIFSNLMDNAINANISINDKQRYINLKCICQGEYMVICTENPANDDRKLLLPQNSTGYGLKILNDIAQKYDGAFKAEIKNGVCETKIMIHNSRISGAN